MLNPYCNFMTYFNSMLDPVWKNIQTQVTFHTTCELEIIN